MSDAYRDYLRRYCGCESPICSVESEEPNDIVESREGVKPHLLITQERVEAARAKDAAYQKANIRLRHDGYIGKCLCPRCGKPGYMSRMKRVNIKTGAVHCHKFFAVHHYVMVDGKAVWHTCFAGFSKSDNL